MANQEAVTALAPRTLDEAKSLSATLAKASILPQALKGKEADVLMTVMAGAELGLGPVQSIRSIHIIEGKPSLSADLIAALCLRRPDVCEHLTLKESSAKVATYSAQRRGSSPVVMSFTIDEARQAGLLGKGNWSKYPAAMLRARCVAAICRAVFPDLVGGLYDSDSGELDREPPTPLHRVESPVPVSSPPTPAPVVDAEIVETPSPAQSSYPAPGLAPASFLGQSSTERAAEAAMDAYNAARAQQAAPPKATPPPAAGGDEVAAAKAEIAAAPNMAALAAIGNRLIKTPHWKAAGLKEAFTARQSQLVSAEKAEAARGAA